MSAAAILGRKHIVDSRNQCFFFYHLWRWAWCIHPHWTSAMWPHGIGVSCGISQPRIKLPCHYGRLPKERTVPPLIFHHHNNNNNKEYNMLMDTAGHHWDNGVPAFRGVHLSSLWLPHLYIHGSRRNTVVTRPPRRRQGLILRGIHEKFFSVPRAGLCLLCLAS